MEKFIVRGFSLDRKVKIFVKVNCVQEVIHEMTSRLKMNDDIEYEVRCSLNFHGT